MWCGGAAAAVRVRSECAVLHEGGGEHGMACGRGELSSQWMDGSAVCRCQGLSMDVLA